jgi:serine kinase of HPr protein (carbohydrate metabolism regulator)
VLLRGESGAGKSDLALRLILGGPYPSAAGRGIELIADDQVLVEAERGLVIARPPAVLAGRIEVRGVGIVELPWRAEAPLALIVDLTPAGIVERMPDPGAFVTLCGVEVPVLQIEPFAASAPLKLLLALDRTLAKAATP